jgi:hypothetical protein
MADDPYAQFDQASQSEAGVSSPPPSAASAPHEDPYHQFDPTPAAPQTSNWLGFYKGAMKPVDNAVQALESIAGVRDADQFVAKTLGMPSSDEGVAAHQKYIQGQEAAGYKPGAFGEFAGNVLGTAPLAIATENPWLIGAGTGALLSDKTTPAGIAEDAGAGALGGKFADIGLNAAGRLLKPLASSAIQRVGGWTGAYSPVMRAADHAHGYVSNLLNAADMAPEDLVQASGQSFGKPLTAAEAIGPTGQAALTALGRRAGATPGALSAQLSERAAGTNDRLLGDYAAASGIHPEAAQGDIDALVEQGRANARPLYTKALSTPGPVWNDDLRQLAQRPVIQNAINSVSEDLKNAGTKPGVFGLPSGPDDQTLMPTAEAWDMVKKRLGAAVDRDPFGKVIPDSISPKNYSINKANSALTGTLKDAIPGYGDALSESGDYLSLQKAFQNGQKFILSPTVTAKQVADHLSGLSDAEAEAFKGGAANQLFNKAQNNQLHASVFDRPILRQKMTAMLGDDPGNTFLDKMAVESKMAKTGARMAPGTNSVTSDVLNATNEQDQNSMQTLIHGLYATANAAHGNGLGAGAHIMAGLRSAGMFGKTGMMPVSVRDEAGRLLMMTPEDLADHLSQPHTAYGAQSVDRIAQLLGSMRPAAPVAGGALAADATAVSPSGGDQYVGRRDGGNVKRTSHEGRIANRARRSKV